MARPGDTTHRLIKVLDSSGSGVTGLTISDFTVTSYGRGYGASSWTTYSASSSLTEISGGLYSISFALPASAGWFRYLLTPTTATYQVFNCSWEGEIETQDFDSLYASVVRTQATLTTSAQLGATVNLELVANRYRELTISVLDSTGAAYDVAANFPDATLRMSVRSLDQTTTSWDAGPSATPTGFSISASSNVLTVIIPEDATFFAALATGGTSAQLYYEITGDLGGDSAKTQPIVRSSSLVLTRYEVGS